MSEIPSLDVPELARRARRASFELAKLSDDVRRKVLLAAAEALLCRSAEILEANHRDCAATTRLVEAGKCSSSILKRLQTNEQGIVAMAQMVREVASLPDPLGKTLSVTALDDDLILSKVTCPLGVVAIIFESRPDVIPQVASLALRSGNALILKGGREAEHSNRALALIWRDVLARFNEIPRDAITMLETREDINQLLSLSGDIDLIIPRGSKEFVQYISTHSSVPVLGHGEGICHVFVDRSAELAKAIAVCLDSKVQYPAACNSAETLLVHKEIAPAFLPVMIARFKEAGVHVKGCPITVGLCGSGIVASATEEDWETEYSDLVISVKVVASLDEAIEHINRWGSKHTECIVTEDHSAAAQFMESVDAAGVYHNVSTRFADGFRYGFGSELGISTSKLHARGPVGLEGLTTYKYKLVGNGHTVASYCSGERSFKHKHLK